jgi:hypothetical protein
MCKRLLRERGKYPKTLHGKKYELPSLTSEKTQKVLWDVREAIVLRAWESHVHGEGPAVKSPLERKR